MYVEINNKRKDLIKTAPKTQNLIKDSGQWTKKLSSRLKSNRLALDYLRDRSLKDETIEYFKLGLSTPYKNKDGVISSDALAFPLKLEDGSFGNSNGYYCIPHVTKNPTDKNGWMKGSPQVYFTHAYRKQSKIFVCEGVKDAWMSPVGNGDTRPLRTIVPNGLEEISHFFK